MQMQRNEARATEAMRTYEERIKRMEAERGQATMDAIAAADERVRFAAPAVSVTYWVM